MIDKDGIPVVRIYALQKQLHQELEDGNWKSCKVLSSDILNTMKLALNPATCKTDKPHIDGVYAVGSMRYERAPKDIKRVLNNMNRVIKTAKRVLG